VVEHPQDYTPYRVNLGELFDGPMDLLVHLVKKNEVDIYDIPIALITRQYMEYLEWMKSVNIDVAGEFLVMAATLAHIKSRMLLPAQEEEGEEEDPRMEIVRPLTEYLQLKYAADDLLDRDRLDWDVFRRRDLEAQEAWSDTDPGFVQVGLFELIDAFQDIIKRVSPKYFYDVTPDTISVKSRISEISELLEEKGSVTFTELFDTEVTRADIVVTFLAILEMAKLQLVRIMQHVESGIIRLFNG
jgi:segregation and condensation protein A